MSYTAKVHNVMIATPSDVQAERYAIREIIHEWNDGFAQSASMVLMPVGWETHAAPAMGARPQEIINERLLRECDLLVAVFWARLGSDTGEAPSGTVEEIREHIKAGKPAMIYFSNTPVVRDSVDLSQYEALKAFQEECRKVGLVEEFGSHEEFRKKFYRQLHITVRNEFHPHLPEPAQVVAPTEQRAGLSAEARTLLLTAAEEDGSILRVRTMGGTFVQSKRTNLCKDNSPREAARWESALEELLQNGLIEERGYKGEVFRVTHLGYEAADQLKA